MKPESISTSIPRVQIQHQNGQVFYVINGWPGWRAVRYEWIKLTILLCIETFLIFVHQRIAFAVDQFDGWLRFLVSSLLRSGIPLIAELVIIALILCFPLILLNRLSHKRVWYDEKYLHIQRTLLNWTRHKRIPKELIFNINLALNGSPGHYLCDVKVTYWLNLPRWLPDVILEKCDRWCTYALDSISDKTEADSLVEQLMSPLTEPS